MSEIISRGTIIVDLKAGTVELPKPDYDQIIKPAQQALDIINAQNAAAQQLTRTVEQQNSAYKTQVAALNEIGRRAFAEGKGDDKWKAGLDSMRAAQEAERAETEKTNQLILADRARRHQRTLAMQEAERQAERQAQQQAAEQAIRDNRAMNESIQRVGEGVMKLTRSAVLLGFAQDESLQSLLKNLALVQAGYDAFDGSRKIIQGLTSVMDQANRSGQTLVQTIGRGNIALAALAVAATAAAVAYQALNAEEEKRKSKYQGAADGVMALRKFTQSLDSPEEKARRAEKEMNSFFRMSENLGDPYWIKAGVKHAEELLGYQKEIEATEISQLNKSRDAIRAQQSQLELAQQRRDAERDIVRSVEAAYSKLSEGEQKRLQAAAEKIRAGGDINEYERELFERAGQGGIADSSRAREGRAEGSQQFIDTVRGLDGAATGTMGSFEDLNRAVTDLEKSLKSLAGDDANAALARIEQRSEDVTRLFEKFQEKLVKRLNEMNLKMTEIATEQGRIAGELGNRGRQ